VSFDALPDRKPWDHAIELEFGAKASSHKVYHYLRMNRLELTPSLRRIWHRVGSVLKSPMAAPVFLPSRSRMEVSDWSRTIGH